MDKLASVSQLERLAFSCLTIVVKHGRQVNSKPSTRDCLPRVEVTLKRRGFGNDRSLSKDEDCSQANALFEASRSLSPDQ